MLGGIVVALILNGYKYGTWSCRLGVKGLEHASRMKTNRIFKVILDSKRSILGRTKTRLAHVENDLRVTEFRNWR